jgi:predicted kinase
VPGIHPTFQIGQFALKHTAGFTDASSTDVAHENMVQVAQALAMTGVDVAMDAGLLEEAKRAFAASR